MQDADLFMELAGIAGVFVGFGALIAVRSGGASDVFEVAWMRGVVSIGLLAVLAALVPVVISRYGLSEHEVWALSSVLFLVGWIATFLINNLSPEARAEGADPVRRSVKIVRLAVWVPSTSFLFLAPIAIALAVLRLRDQPSERTGWPGPFASGPVPVRRPQSAAGGRL